METNEKILGLLLSDAKLHKHENKSGLKFFAINAQHVELNENSLC